jgi:high-affinity iron transporter
MAGFPLQAASWCNPLQADSQAVRAGAALFASNCASCHGEAGKGDGPGAALASPVAYDFTRPEFAGMREAPGAASVYAMLARGIDGTAMKAFPDLSGWERLAVMAYLMQLPGPEAIRASRAWADSLRARRR